MQVDVSPGEVLDRVSILLVKLDFFKDPVKINNVKHEIATLTDPLIAIRLAAPDRMEAWLEDLKIINKQIWEVIEVVGQFIHDRGLEFSDAAAQTYLLNIERARKKREIDLALNSKILEEKSY